MSKDPKVRELVKLMRQFLSERPGMTVDDIDRDGRAHHEWLRWLQVMVNRRQT